MTSSDGLNKSRLKTIAVHKIDKPQVPVDSQAPLPFKTRIQ